MNFGPHTPEEDSHRIMDAAVAYGINFVDTANIYGRHLGVGATEEIIGRWFAKGERPSREGRPRDEGVGARWATGRTSPACRSWRSSGSARRRSRGCRPTGSTSTRCTTSTGKRGGTRSGRRWTSSSATARSSTSAPRTSPDGTSRARTRSPDWRQNSLGLATEQSVYNLNERTIELEVIPAVMEYGMGLIPYSPLAGGLLAGALEKVNEGRRSSRVPAGRDPSTSETAAALGAAVQGAGRAPRRRRAGVAAPPAGGHRAAHRSSHRGPAAGSMRALEIRMNARCCASSTRSSPARAGRARGVRLVGRGGGRHDPADRCTPSPSARSISRAASITAGAYRFAEILPIRDVGPLIETTAMSSPFGPSTGAETLPTPGWRSPALDAHPRRRAVASWVSRRRASASCRSSGAPAPRTAPDRRVTSTRGRPSRRTRRSSAARPRRARSCGARSRIAPSPRTSARPP